MPPKRRTGTPQNAWGGRSGADSLCNSLYDVAERPRFELGSACALTVFKLDPPPQAPSGTLSPTTLNGAPLRPDSLCNSLYELAA